MSEHDANARPTPAWEIALAWAVVLIPLGWGFWETLVQAAALFR